MRPAAKGKAGVLQQACQGNCVCLGGLNIVDRDLHRGNICGVEQYTGEWERVEWNGKDGGVEWVTEMSGGMADLGHMGGSAGRVLRG